MNHFVTIPTGPNSAAGMQRARGIGRIGFARDGGKTRLKDLYQSGSARVRVPRVYDGPPVGVLINTAGGVTGGDRFDYEGHAGADCHVVLSTQAAERAYKRTFGIGTIDVRLSVGPRGTLEWLPQETILFQGSALKRTMNVELSGSARLCAIESVVLGRTAMGEEITETQFSDKWRIHRDGRLIFAENMRLNGNGKEILAKSATGSGGAAFATFVDVCPNAEDRLDAARNALKTCDCRAAASAWNGVLTARFVAKNGCELRMSLIHFLEHYRACPLPRVWHC